MILFQTFGLVYKTRDWEKRHDSEIDFVFSSLIRTPRGNEFWIVSRANMWFGLLGFPWGNVNFDLNWYGLEDVVFVFMIFFVVDTMVEFAGSSANIAGMSGPIRTFPVSWFWTWDDSVPRRAYCRWNLKSKYTVWWTSTSDVKAKSNYRTVL
jgi:hypothetical protein